MLTLLAAPALAFEMTKPYMVRAVDEGGQRFGPLLYVDGAEPGQVTLAFGDADLATWVGLVDEPCAGAECLGGVRVVALGTAGGQGVETVIAWGDGLGHPLGETRVEGSVAAGFLAWAVPASPARCVAFGGTDACEGFSGTETELAPACDGFSGTETELSPDCAAQVTAAFASDHAAASPDPTLRSAVEALAAAWVTFTLASGGTGP